MSTHRILAKSSWTRPGAVRRGPKRVGLIGLVGLLTATAPTAAERLVLDKTSIELPAAPAAIVSTDLDGDGIRDLAVMVVWTDWGELTSSRETQTEVGLAEVLTVVPALLERRELRVFRGTGDGYEPAAEPLPVGPDVLALGAAPPSVPLWALTDDGFAAVRLETGREPGRPGIDRLTLVPLSDEPPVLAGTGAFTGGLELTHDLDGDGAAELLLPAGDAIVLYRLEHAARSDEGSDGEGAPPSGARAREIARLPLPTDVRLARRDGPLRRYPLPVLRDLDGDRRPEALFPDADRRWSEVTILRGRDLGTGAPPLGPLEMAPAAEQADEPLDAVWLGDLDGDGRGELLRSRFLGDQDLGFRDELRQAKRPPYRYFLHRLGDDLRPEPTPYASFDASGYAFDGGSGDGGGGSGDGSGEGDIAPSIGLLDLDGDGDRDLVTLTLDFSLFQAVRILATKSIKLGLDFHVYCQEDDGFRAVEGLDLSGTFRLDLRNIRVGSLAQFRGDFDGDGRLDFLQMGRGRDLSIHRGRPGCRYPSEPDLVLRLDEEPRDLALVRVEDYDADGRDDVLVIQPRDATSAGVSPTVRLDLYRGRSAGGEGR